MMTRAGMRAEMVFACVRSGRIAQAVMHANAMAVYARMDRQENADEISDIADGIRRMYREEGAIR